MGILYQSSFIKHPLVRGFQALGVSKPSLPGCRVLGPTAAAIHARLKDDMVSQFSIAALHYLQQ